MPDIIHLLPDSVANQIAAGEVIQRPASVVKELVENSIDAGATKVEVWITEAGKTCIQVVDNGKGMSETDARMSFERHATSKITQAADLYALRTMGFRGEALASIAAVARVELKTRTADNEVGIRLLLENSVVTSQRPEACPVGTNFTIRDLFFNVPARRKFLKSDHTELRRISEEFERVALANPDVEFRLYNNNTEILGLPRGSRKIRIGGIFGKKIEQRLLPVKVETTIVKMEGFVVSPEDAVKKGAHQYFFVNGRYMRHPYFQKAVSTAYERLVADGEQPHFFLFMEVDPSRIDVNVHPTKTEIKFEDEQAIWQIVLAAVKETLGKFNAIPTIEFDNDNMPDIPAFHPGRVVERPQVQVDTSFNPFAGMNTSARSSYGGASRLTNVYDLAKSTLDTASELPDAPEDAAESKLYQDQSEEMQMEWEATEATCMQYDKSYIIAARGNTLMIADQHRAHLRILYDSIIKTLVRQEGVSQRLIFPEMLHLSPAEQTVFDKIKEELTAIGFELSDLGRGSYSINGVPPGVEGQNPVILLQSLLTGAVEKAGGIKEDIYHMMAITLARKAAVRRGQALSEAEMIDIMQKLSASAAPRYTPEGKKIFTDFNPDKVGKLLN